MFRAFLLLFALSVLACRNAPSLEQFPILGEEVISVNRYETQAQASHAWSGLKLRKAALILLSPVSVFSNTGDPEVFGNTASSVDAGVVNEIYWVVPDILYDDIVEAEHGIRQTLSSIEHSGFTPDAIAGMSYANGCLSGNRGGIAIHFCNLSNLPKLEKPAILSIDASFFPIYADARGVSKLSAVRDVYTMLFMKKYHTGFLTVSCGIHDGRARPLHRYLCEAAEELAGKPEMLLGSAPPPPRWVSRDVAEALFTRGRYEDLQRHVELARRTVGYDPDLSFASTAALVRRKSFRRALTEAEGICRKSEQYCIGLQYLGYLAELDGEPKWAETFYERARSLSHGSFPLPQRLFYAGRTPGQEQGAQ